jgi:hypothetical protein
MEPDLLTRATTLRSGMAARISLINSFADDNASSMVCSRYRLLAFEAHGYYAGFGCNGEDFGMVDSGSVNCCG